MDSPPAPPQATPAQPGGDSGTDAAPGVTRLTVYSGDYEALRGSGTVGFGGPGHALVDASASWTSGDDRFKLSVNMRNLFDKQYRVGGYNFPGALFGNSIIGYYGPPRTATFTAEYRF